MKKFVLILLIALLSLPVLAFAACAEPADDPYDLSTKEIGYEIPVYPDCEFSYKIIKTEYNYETMQYEVVLEEEVHISEFSATFVRKNTIEENALLTGYFYPYTIRMYAVGKTSPSLEGKSLAIFTHSESFNAKVNADGSIIWDSEIDCTNTDVREQVTFRYIYI